jgi:hypothetical protein
LHATARRETVEKARGFLERNGRVSLRAFRREFDLDDDALGTPGSLGPRFPRDSDSTVRGKRDAA